MSDIPRKSVETFGIRLLTQVVGTLTSVLIARTLGPYGRGIFSYVSSVLAILVTFNAGQSMAISWQYGRLKHPSQNVLAAMLRILVILAVPLVLTIAILALTLKNQRPLLAVALATPFAFFAQMATAFQLTDGKVRVVNVQNLISTLGFLLIVTPVLIFFHVGVEGMLAVWACSYTFSAAYAAVMLRPYMGKHPGVKADAAQVKQQAIFGIKASANSLVALLNFRIDVFLVLFFLGVKALGIYSVAVGAGEVVWQLTRPLALTAFGRINSGTLAESTRLTAKCVRHSMALVTATCVILYFVGPTLISFLYGPAFRDAGFVLRVLLPGIVAYSMTPFFSTFFSQQLSRPSIPLVILSISTVVCAVITAAMIRSLGMVAGAIGTSVSYLSTFVISVLVFRRETGISLRALFGFRAEDIRPYASLAGSFWKRIIGYQRGD
jgi:O-antigen/teichoic acid export membrane protein